MKKNLFRGTAVLWALVLPLAVGGRAVRADEAAPKTDNEKLSYAVGLNIGASLKPMKRMGVELDVDSLVKGLRNAVTGSPPLLSSNEINGIMTAFQAELPVKTLRAGQDFLAKNKTQPGVQSLDDGLQYKVLSDGSGAKPKVTDTVVVNYRGTFIDGESFDASKEGKPNHVAVADVPKGWAEALLLMPVGAKWRIYLSSDLAYGAKGAQNIPAYSTVVFEIELLAIEAPSAPGAAAPSDASKAPILTRP